MQNDEKTTIISRRVPHGTRGLKFLVYQVSDSPDKSGPTRDPWIEITIYYSEGGGYDPSGPTRDPWIEMSCLPFLCLHC